MSRRKRRRTVKKKDPKDFSHIKDPRKRLQAEVVKSIDAFQACKIFCGNWRLTTQAEWWGSTPEQLTEKIMKASKGYNFNRYHPLFRALKSLNLPILKKIYLNNFKNKQKKIRREVTCWEIIYRFFGEETPLEKRENEKSNLAEIGNLEEMIRFITLCDIVVPNEILNIIFSYIPNTLGNIVKVGKVCKHFYISFLCNWKSVRIHKGNIRKIPLLVFRSVRSIEITGALLVDDLDYIWPLLNNERIRTFTFPYEVEKSVKSLRKYLNECTKKNEPYSLQNINKIKFYGYQGDYWDNDYSSLFPGGIHTISNHYEHFVELCPAQRLSFSSLPTFPYKLRNDDDLQQQYFSEVLGNYERVSSVEFNNVNFNDFEPIEKPGQPTTSTFKRSLDCFTNIEDLMIELLNWTNVTQNCGFHFRDFNSFNCLQKIVIKNGNHNNTHRGESSGAISVTYDLENTKIKELNIDSSTNVTFATPIIDFNMEDVIKTDFLVSNKHGIIKFKADFPLLSRRRHLDKIGRDVNSEEFGIVCSETALIISKLMNFMESNMCERYELFDIQLRTPKGWRRCERWIMRYEKKIKRVRIWMYVRSSKQESDKRDTLKDCDLLEDNLDSKFDRRKSCEEFLMEKRMPGLLLTREFMVRVLKKIESQVNLVLFESLMFFGPGSKILTNKVNQFLEDVGKRCLKDSFVYDDESRSFFNMSIL